MLLNYGILEIKRLRSTISSSLGTKLKDIYMSNQTLFLYCTRNWKKEAIFYCKIPLLCEFENREHFDLILTFPIVQQPIRRDMKLQENQTNVSHETTLGFLHSKRLPFREVFSLLACLSSSLQAN